MATDENSTALPLADAMSMARNAISPERVQPLWRLTADGIADSLRSVGDLQAALDGALVALAADALDRGLHTASATTIGGFLASHTRLDRQSCMRAAALAERLPDLPTTAAALGAGELSAAHAAVIGKTMAGLPAAARGREAEAEQLLVEQAALLNPQQLARVGAGLREALAAQAPSVDSPEDAAALAAEADRLAEAGDAGRFLDLRQQRDGRWFLRGLLTQVDGAKLATALEPLAAPTPADDGVRDERTAGQRNADAFGILVDGALAAGELPEHGGEVPQLFVSLDYDVLAAQVTATMLPTDDQLPHAPALGVGRLSTGGTLCPADLRMLGCDAKIIPAVLGKGGSETLDLGRGTRLYPPTLRRALAARDGGCCWPGCSAPTARCHAHHQVHWSDGGPTNLANGALYCPLHHRMLHRQGWTSRLAASNGRPELIPPTDHRPAAKTTTARKVPRPPPARVGRKSRHLRRAARLRLPRRSRVRRPAAAAAVRRAAWTRRPVRPCRRPGAAVPDQGSRR